MHLLALDIGTRRTGCAYCDESMGIPFPLDTLTHTSVEEFAALVSSLVEQRKIDRLIVGLPLLLSGKEGSQAEAVRAYVDTLQSLGVETTFLDERYTTPKTTQADGDAMAAFEILSTYLQKNNN